MTPESFRTDLASAGLGRHVETIAALAKPCIQLETVPGDDTAGRVGASRLGGEPDLPPGEPWPEWQGTPMSFLVQIDLATVAGLPGADVLPSDGPSVVLLRCPRCGLERPSRRRGLAGSVHSGRGLAGTRTHSGCGA
jgi:hypothetical protein